MTNDINALAQVLGEENAADLKKRLVNLLIYHLFYMVVLVYMMIKLKKQLVVEYVKLILIQNCKLLGVIL
jgi:hypothetical protein